MIRSRFAAIALATALMLAATARADENQVLRFVPHADLTIIDPYFSGVYITRNYGYMVYDTLFALDHEFRPHRQMVDSWKASNDGLTWEFTLRNGLKFHDGQPVRATDVVASLKRWGQRNDSYGQTLLDAAAAIEALDDMRFQIALKRPFPVIDALATMTSPTPFIMPERLAQIDAYTQIKDPTGSGPFKMVMSEWQPGHKVVFARNADYVPRAEPPDGASGAKIAKVDRVEWIYIPDAVTALQALKDGEVDAWENLPNDYVAGLRHDPDVKIKDSPGFVGTMRFNWLQPPFDNVKMRQAVLQVVDQSDYMAAMAGDQENWRTCYSVYACLGDEVTRGSEALSGPRDYDRAKKLVTEAGYNGEPVVLLDPADIPQLHAEATVTADLLKRLGLNVEVATTEWGTVIKRIYSKDPVAQGGWNVFVTAFAAYDMLNPATTRNLRAPGAKGVLPGWADDEKLEALRAAWFAATDDAARREIAAQIQQRAFEVVPFIPLGQYHARAAFRSYLTGVVDAPIAFLWNIEKGR
ncbi:MAG TPA: ABC transporter substrate-binding protein [Stellaceae bacterium]|nr:ABC transporter substrate-binding protein [Stellaceae bacterium]